jgi:hypothetical protein
LHALLFAAVVLPASCGEVIPEKFQPGKKIFQLV